VTPAAAPGTRRRQAWVRYVVDVAVAMGIGYPALVLLSVWFLRSHPGSVWRYAVAVAPMAPVLWLAFAAVRFLHQADELERRIQLEAIAFSFVVTAVGTLSYAFLQSAGLPPLNPWWIWIVMTALWAGGVMTLKIRYR
jgi:hypothetical protein